MLNTSGIKKETATAPTQILFNVQNQMAVGVLVSDTGVVAGADGKKFVKAGAPLNGNLEARDTGFTARADTTKPAVGVLLHDVEVTTGPANGSLLIWGFVNLNRIDSTTAALITATAKTELTGKVTFLKD